MNRIYFKHTFSPCVDNEITRWHLAHGWLWDVYDRKLEQNIGVFLSPLCVAMAASFTLTVLSMWMLKPLLCFALSAGGLNWLLHTLMWFLLPFLPKNKN